MGWSEGPFMGFDTETTGVKPAIDRIVTAACVEWRHGQTREQTWLADPGVPIPEPAQQVHGISTEYAREHGRPLEQVVTEVAQVLEACGQAQIPVVIYNASFDLPLLDHHLERLGLPIMRERVEFLPIIDPLVLDRALDRYRKGKRTLGALAEFYQVRGEDNLHDALVDVRQTIAVLRALCAAYPQLEQMDLRQLQDYQRDQYREWAQHFNQYLLSKGRSADVNEEWLA